MNTLKALFVIAVIIASVQSVTITQEMKDKFMAIAKECQGKAGASAEDLTLLIKHEQLSTKEGKCMLSCCMEKYGTLINGKLNKEASMQISMAITKNDPAGMKIAEEIVDACVGINVSADQCEAADQYTICMRKAASDKGVSYVEN